MPSWQDFQPFLVTGFAIGGVYALSGVGLVVLYRATGVLNLAFGAIGAMGALLAWQCIDQYKLSEWIGYLVCIAFAAALTLAYGLVFGPPLAHREPLVKAAATLGLALVLLGAMDIVWTASGGAARALSLPTDNDTFQIGQILVNWTQVIAFALGIAITAGTGAFLRTTKLGRAMRAVANDREITAMLGVPVRRVEAAAWLGSGVLAGLAGLFLADLIQLDATTLTFLVLSSLAATLVAMLRSITITLVAAIVIGLVSSMVTPIQSLTNYADMTPFVVAALALFVITFRRREDLGHAERLTVSLRDRSATGGVDEAVPGAPMVAATERRWWLPGASSGLTIRVLVIAALFLFSLLALPELISLYYVDALTEAAIYAVVAAGLGVLVGRVGLYSLGQAAVLAIGAWTAARLLFATGLPYPVVLLAAALMTMVIGTILGLPALRVRGLYLALITLMLAGAISVVLATVNFPNGAGGFLGYNGSAVRPPAIRRPTIAVSDPAYYRYTLVVAAVMFVVVILHVRSRPGRAWAAIRQSESAALAAGINVTFYKLWAWALASFVTGAAGGLLAGASGYLYSIDFPVQNSITLLAVVLMGGAYNLWGAVVAGLLLELLPALFQSWNVSYDWTTILFGVGVLQVLTTAPRGIVDQMPRDLRRLGRLIGGVLRRRLPAEAGSP